MRPIKFRAKTVERTGYAKKSGYMGHLFKTLLTAENFEADSFQSRFGRLKNIVYRLKPPSGIVGASMYCAVTDTSSQPSLPFSLRIQVKSSILLISGCKTRYSQYSITR